MISSDQCRACYLTRFSSCCNGNFCSYSRKCSVPSVFFLDKKRLGFFFFHLFSLKLSLALRLILCKHGLKGYKPSLLLILFSLIYLLSFDVKCICSIPGSYHHINGSTLLDHYEFFFLSGTGWGT